MATLDWTVRVWSLFADRIVAGTADVTVLPINKQLSVPERQAALGLTNEALRESGIDPDTESLAHELAEEMARRYRHVCGSEDKPFKRRASHPYPSMNEPGKQVLDLYVTGKREPPDLGWVLARTNVMSIDRFFTRVRRRLNVLERPISTSSHSWRRWQEHSAYNPVVVMKLLEVFRAAYNYHLRGRDRKSPGSALASLNEPCPWMNC